MSQANPSVSVLGLGAMGGVLAQTLVQSGCAVTVWNRSPERAASLVQAGATLARDVPSALLASDLIIICMIDKAASEALLQSLESTFDLGGRTLVNMSTGTVTDVERLACWSEEHNAQYLDGGILCYPKDIGAAHTAILYSGHLHAWQQHQQTLTLLGGNPRYLGCDPKACTPAYLALYAFYFGAFAAWLEGAVLASSAGVSVDAFKTLSSIMTDMLVDGIDTAAARISAGEYGGEQASVDVHVAGQEVVLDALLSAGVPHASTDAYLSYCRLAQTAGMGNQDIAAVYKAMQP
ncbi:MULTISPECIES: NAD(P)-dependent oxidoreductase [unclassified Pseudomonas]|uniref:NAD(P)-dependent oxidoreductase n=1 Tax=unclassified Pseudomonas TaxID=196821 RepID=UPI0025F4EA45|nr:MULTISPECIES: NAD(P)-binding domain-containing protein [unclassified Pseudomonas]